MRNQTLPWLHQMGGQRKGQQQSSHEPKGIISYSSFPHRLPRAAYNLTPEPCLNNHVKHQQCTHRNLPFLPQLPPSAYGCQQTWEQTYPTPLTFLLPKKTYCSLAAHSESSAACPAKSILLGTSTSVKLAQHFVHRHSAISTHGQDCTQSKGQRGSIQYVFQRHKADSRMCLAALEVPCLYERNYIAKPGRFGLCHSLTRQLWCQVSVW